MLRIRFHLFDFPHVVLNIAGRQRGDRSRTTWICINAPFYIFYRPLIISPTGAIPTLPFPGDFPAKLAIRPPARFSNRHRLARCFRFSRSASLLHRLSIVACSPSDGSSFACLLLVGRFCSSLGIKVPMYEANYVILAHWRVRLHTPRTDCFYDPKNTNRQLFRTPLNVSPRQENAQCKLNHFIRPGVWGSCSPPFLRGGGKDFPHWNCLSSQISVPMADVRLSVFAQYKRRFAQRFRP